MARERCNLDKEEAEILKPSSSSSTSPAHSPPATTSPPPLFLKPSQELPIPRLDRAETPEKEAAAAAAGPGPAASSCKRKLEEDLQPPVRFGNRCSSCRKRVGLTGFRCRCGNLFCARHRYSDVHGCSFDYKAAGREEISKANPVIKAAKIIKI